MLRRFNSREVPAAACARAGHERYTDARTTKATFGSRSGSEAIGRSQLAAVEVEVVDCPIRGFAPVRAAAEVWIPGLVSSSPSSAISTNVLQSQSLRAQMIG